MQNVIPLRPSDPVDTVQLRLAIRKDLMLVQEYANLLEAMAAKCNDAALRCRLMLDGGCPAMDLAIPSAADLDMAASRAARRIDHLQALLEVACASEAL
jgi:hypothetical protein